MKKMNKKGFTLIELLAVIVVLAIILVITVPMILNTLGDTRQNALQSSADSIEDYYRNQLSLEALGEAESSVVTSNAVFVKGALCPIGTAANATACAASAGTAQSISADADKLGISSADYDLANSTVSWDGSGKVTVCLKGTSKDGAQFDQNMKSSGCSK